MDGRAEQLVQLLAEAAEQEQPGILRQVDEQVQVGVGALLAPGDTPEHPHVAHAVLGGQRQHGGATAPQPVADRAAVWTGAPAGPYRAAGRG